jgi:hypothetical protein
VGEATLGAIVSCLFRILSTHTGTSQDLLDLATKIVEKVQSVRSSSLDMALYSGVTIFVENVAPAKGVDVAVGDKSDAKNTSSASRSAPATGPRGSFGGEDSEEGDQPGARFQPLIMAVFAYPSEPWRQPERARKSRVDLGLALARQRPSLKDPRALASILDPWLVEERSRPLREDLERAAQACKSQL